MIEVRIERRREGRSRSSRPISSSPSSYCRRATTERMPEAPDGIAYVFGYGSLVAMTERGGPGRPSLGCRPGPPARPPSLLGRGDEQLGGEPAGEALRRPRDRRPAAHPGRLPRHRPASRLGRQRSRDPGRCPPSGRTRRARGQLPAGRCHGGLRADAGAAGIRLSRHRGGARALPPPRPRGGESSSAATTSLRFGPPSQRSGRSSSRSTTARPSRSTSPNVTSG